MLSHTPYDRRFVHVFLTQLEHRAWPRFPGRAWFAALACADREADYVRPFCGPPVTPQKVQLKGEPSRSFHWRTQTLVNAACARWWRKYGPR